MTPVLFIVAAGITILYIQKRRAMKAKSALDFTVQIYALAEKWQKKLPEDDPSYNYWYYSIRVKASRVTDLVDQIDIWWLMAQVLKNPRSESITAELPKWCIAYDEEIKVKVLIHSIQQSPLLCAIYTGLHSMRFSREMFRVLWRKLIKLFDGPIASRDIEEKANGTLDNQGEFSF